MGPDFRAIVQKPLPDERWNATLLATNLRVMGQFHLVLQVGAGHNTTAFFTGGLVAGTPPLLGTTWAEFHWACCAR